MTTVALALAAGWPEEADGGVRPVVVESGVWGGDLAVRFGLSYTPGLLDVAAAARQPQPGSLLGAVSELPVGVRVVVAPADRGPCAEAVRLLTTDDGPRVLRGEASDRGSVVLDVGRIGTEVRGLVEAADQVVLVARGEAEALAHLYAYRGETASFAERLTLTVVGRCPYADEEITNTLEMGRACFLPWDAKTADVLGGRARAARSSLRTGGWRPLPLVKAAGGLARQLAGVDVEVPEVPALPWLRPRRALPGGVRSGLAGVGSSEGSRS